VAGHDINYIAVAGALGAMRRGERPLFPLNLVGPANEVRASSTGRTEVS